MLASCLAIATIVLGAMADLADMKDSSAREAPTAGPIAPAAAEIIFFDNFDDGTLGADWSTVYGGVGTHTYSSSPCSAYIYGYTDSVTSRAIVLSSYNQGNVSYWLRRGSSTFSENPEDGENLQVEYYSNTGSWNLLESFPGAGSGGEIFVRTHQLPSDAMHSGFRLRFRLVAGSGSGCDYWHIDDVLIQGSLGAIPNTGAQVMTTLLVIAGAVATALVITYSYKTYVKRFRAPTAQVMYRSTTASPGQQTTSAAQSSGGTGIANPATPPSGSATPQAPIPTMATPQRPSALPTQPNQSPLHTVPARQVNPVPQSPTPPMRPRPLAPPGASPFPSISQVTGAGSVAVGTTSATGATVASVSAIVPGASTIAGAGVETTIERSPVLEAPIPIAEHQMPAKDVEAASPDVQKKPMPEQNTEHVPGTGPDRDDGLFDDMPAIGSLFDGEQSPEPQPEQMPVATTGHDSQEPPEVLRVAPAGHHVGSQVEPLVERAASSLVLGCNACGTTMVIAHPSNELLYVCKACKQPLHVIRDCPACGNKLLLTQDEHHATAPSGNHCPVCLESLAG